MWAQDWRVLMAGGSDRGQVRANNQDAIGLWPEFGLCALADGMGGHKAGEVASQLAIDTLGAAAERIVSRLQQPATGPAELLESIVQLANQTILQAAQNSRAHQGMGTTLVVLLQHAGALHWASVGDSRLYQWRQGVLRQLTRDHNLFQQMVDQGYHRHDNVGNLPGRNVLTRALGINEQLEVDTGSEPIQHDDCYLLCSDGLTNMLEDRLIGLELDAADNSLDDLVTRLIAMANAAGGSDNVSVVLARALREGW